MFFLRGIFSIHTKYIYFSDCNSSAGCQAPVASASTKELRLKGSSFLRRHASRHGIANASRKLTAQVIRELSQHYYTAHKVVVADDDLQVRKINPGGLAQKCV